MLNYKRIYKIDLQIIAKVKPFMIKYNWEGIKFPLEKDNWGKFDKNNVTIALNIMCPKKKKKYILLITINFFKRNNF